MKIDLIFKILILLFIASNVFADEIEIENSKMEVIDNGNLILGYDSRINIPLEKITINSDKSEYDKKNGVITFFDNVIFKDKKNNIIIKSDKLKYFENKDLIFSESDTKIDLENKYKIDTKNIYFDRSLNEIYSRSETLIEDENKNFYILKDRFNFDIDEEIIKSKKSTILDNNFNKYIFEDLVIYLKNNQIVGNELKIEFEDSYFGNYYNDPLLKGRSVYSDDSELRVYKAVFSTCSIKDKDCRGWELNTEEFKHDKEKKIFEYKNSWLKIFDYKVFFLPFFNHPDPSVKRKSGFLTPTYSTSESLGTSVNVPYFKTLGNDKDITFNPRIFADKSFLLQNEYRQALKSSKILNDFSFLVGEAGSKGHFFYNQIGELKKNLNFEINLQNVKGDNYLKNYKLSDTSSLIKDDNLLLSNLDLDWSFSDSSLNTSFKVFEDLSRNYHDRYQYIFPDFNFIKDISIPESYNGNFTYNSYGYNKNYNTNVTESEMTNDFLFSSLDFINEKGLMTNYELLLKNSNTYANNSTNFEENTNYSLFGTVKIDTSLPLKRSFENHTNFLKPVLSLRYSPNGNNDISTKNILLNYDNVFNLNRIGSSNQVEGGDAISLGLEFQKVNEEGINKVDFKIANVLKSDENIKLPSKSKLDKTRSDIFGGLNYNVNDNLDIGYLFSYDRDLEYSNLDQINLQYEVNNFLTNFSYYTEDNDFEPKESIKNNSSIFLDEENKLSFEITKDLKEDFTQYYNLIYAYETDCISINLNYNKSFFRDGNIKPNESLSFLIKIIPFTEIGVPNVGQLIKN